MQNESNYLESADPDLKIGGLLEIIDCQTGYFRVIYYLYTHMKGHINKMSGDMCIGDRTLYRVFDILLSQNVIYFKEEQEGTRGIRKNYYLTEKGKHVARNLVRLSNAIRGIQEEEIDIINARLEMEVAELKAGESTGKEVEGKETLNREKLRKKIREIEEVIGK